ncbi:MAG: aldo/keto reductase [Planctomycetota bacterium]
MPLDHYVTLGRSGLRVSPFCLGTMTFGEEWGWGSTPEDSIAIIDAYRDAGGNFIDTANIYTKGHSEVIIGDHLAKTPGLRDRMVVATKFLGNMFPGDPNGGGAHRKSMMAACEESLRRLKTDYIDLYWMHFWDPNTPIDETVRAMDDLVRQGKVRYFGISDTPAWKCVQAQCEAIFKNQSPAIALQIEYSLIERTPESDLLPMAEEMGMGVTPWSPLKGGILTGKYTRDKLEQDEGRGAAWTREVDERAFTIIDALVEVADDAGCTPAQAALRWAQDGTAVTSTIIGARTLSQLNDNIAALDVTLTDAHRTKLNDASAFEMPFPQKFLQNIPTVVQGGTTVNGEARDPWPMAPKSDDERW